MFLCVLEVVLGVGQDLKEGLDKLLVLQKMAVVRVSGDSAAPLRISKHLPLSMPRGDPRTVLTIRSFRALQLNNGSSSPWLLGPWSAELPSVTPLSHSYSKLF